MKGDFTRWTFDPRNEFTRVFQQQGRVHLDADWNEQTAILLHHLRTLAEDVIGPFGAPANPDGTPGEGFRPALQIGKDGQPVKNVYRLLGGRYYVGGILVENREELIQTNLPAGRHLLYLDVWERLVTYVQNDLLREVALGGVDTAARAQVAWRVRTEAVKDDVTCRRVRRTWAERVRQWQPENRGSLKARAQAPANPQDDDPCLVAPEARYTGENQLYRVEVHNGGTAAAGATFKWSRENGSVVFPVLNVKDGTVTLEHLGRDGRFGLQKGNWVELLDDDGELRDPVSPLLKVADVDPDRSLVRLEGTLPAVDAGKHRYLRRWDHAERKGSDLLNGAVRIQEDGWLELENGIQIRFEAAEAQEGHGYRTGDYWLIPARTATADVEWPGPFDNPEARPPHGVEHRYAPLALVTVAGNGTVTVEDCRTTFGDRGRSLNTGRAEWRIVRGDGPLPRFAVVVEKPDVGWSRALLPARWISGDPSAQAPGGTTRFELVFQLDDDDLRDISLSLSLLADNSAEVLLNDRPLGRHERPGNKGFTGEPSRMETEDPAFFRKGENRLAVDVTNAEGGPMGLVLAGRVGSDRRCC